jgi:hypothetical protein
MESILRYRTIFKKDGLSSSNILEMCATHYLCPQNTWELDDHQRLNRASLTI